MSVTSSSTFPRNLIGFVLAVGLLAAWALVSLVGITWAHDYNPRFKWNDDDATPLITNYNTQYQQAILSAYDDYDAKTYLDVEWCAYPCGANIIHYEANFGPVRGTAEAHVFSDSNSCFPVGYCNETDRRANFAYVYWNSYYGPYDGDGANYLARHEMGHAFGLAHVPCSHNSSVMYTGCTAGLPSKLQVHDKTDINDAY